MGVLLFFCESNTVLLLMPFKIALLLALSALMNLVVSDSTQLCFTRMVARAGLMDSRKFRTAPSLFLHNRLCVWPRMLGCPDHLNLDSVIYSIISSSQFGAIWGLLSLPPLSVISQIIVKTLDRACLRIELHVLRSVTFL